jgi:pyruvate,orthophosphate dikinase
VLKLPVPPGFTISTDACREYMHTGWPTGLDAEIAAHVKKLEATMGRMAGRPARPVEYHRLVQLPPLRQRHARQPTT